MLTTTTINAKFDSHLVFKHRKGTYIGIADWLIECVGELLLAMWLILQLNRVF